MHVAFLMQTKGFNRPLMTDDATPRVQLFVKNNRLEKKLNERFLIDFRQLLLQTVTRQVE